MIRSITLIAFLYLLYLGYASLVGADRPRGDPRPPVAFSRDGTGRFRVEWRAVADAAPFGA